MLRNFRTSERKEQKIFDTRSGLLTGWCVLFFFRSESGWPRYLNMSARKLHVARKTVAETSFCLSFNQTVIAARRLLSRFCRHSSNRLTRFLVVSTHSRSPMKNHRRVTPVEFLLVCKIHARERRSIGSRVFTRTFPFPDLILCKVRKKYIKPYYLNESRNKRDFP